MNESGVTRPAGAGWQPVDVPGGAGDGSSTVPPSPPRMPSPSPPRMPPPPTQQPGVRPPFVQAPEVPLPLPPGSVPPPVYGPRPPQATRAGTWRPTAPPPPAAQPPFPPGPYHQPGPPYPALAQQRPPTAAARIADATNPYPGWRPPPSGLMPSGPQRPTYREPAPVTAARVAIGVFAGTVWMGLFGLLASTAAGYAWLTIVASALAWPTLVVLTRYGDRGVAAGAAMSCGCGLAIAAMVVATRWFAGDWLLW